MCDCIHEVNEALIKAGKNTKLDIPITWHITKDKNVTLNNSRVAIKTCKRDESKREKPISVFPSFCPFCGEAYQ